MFTVSEQQYYQPSCVTLAKNRRATCTWTQV